jgi:Bacterial alpha-L-rhamnosidase 6 hairpin glycosidase domain/Alpha-L-rhamnosidase N-terminal domain/Bacterial alpha-L-rhamnosidase concanavalin-like domain/Bacterial alpha-L-rhamnosidase C-terminal domain
MEYRKERRAGSCGRLAAAIPAGLFVLLGCLSGVARAAPIPVQVGGLSVDHMTEPTPIEDAKPTFGWKLESTGRGVSQTAYEVQVAESAADLAAGTDLWDSGQVESAESVEVPYGGPAPGAGRSYVWRVRVWDQEGQASAWSASARWRTALLHESEWGGAQWITPKSTTEAANWSNYRLEVDFSIATGAAGVVFRERDPDDFYMWQIQVGTEHVVLRPHIETGGAFHILEEIPLDGILEPDEAQSEHHLTIVAEGSTITTSIDGTQVDQLSNSTIASGGIGFRSGSAAEDASFSNLNVEEIGGGQLFSDDFGANPDPAFPGAQIEAGTLRDRQGALDLISTAPTAPLLRKAFTLEQPIAQVASARVYAFGLGLYEMDLDGAKVGDRVFTPPVTDYTTRMRYQTYAVAPRLLEGENVLGMTLAEGYGPSFSSSGQRWLGPRQAKAMLEVRYRDGTTQRVVTDESWRWSEGPVIGAGIYAGETYDARRMPVGWDEPGFDGSSWGPVKAATAPGGRMEADTTPPVRVVRTIQPVAMSEPAAGTYVFDFGEDISGWTRLDVSGPGGTVVQLRYAEDLLPNGHLDTTTNGFAESTDRFVLAGSDSGEEFEPTFTYHGFRYVEVTGLPAPPTASTLVAQVVHADMAQNASFESSDPLLDAIFEQNRRTMINNAMSYPTDNPVRNERTGPGMDVQAYADASTRIFGTDRFFGAYLQETSGGFGGSPDMNEANIPLAWDVYEQYGDRRALEAAYHGMASSMIAYKNQSSGLVWPEDVEFSGGFGDWCAPALRGEVNEGVGGGEVGGYFECFSEVSVVNTALAYRNARITAMAAEALGKHAEAVEFEELAERIEAAFENAFATPDGYGTERQVTSVLPLAFGMVPADRRAAVSNDLVDRILGPDEGHLDTGIFGTRFLVDALVAAGRPDVALTVLNQTTYPGFGYELGFGAQIGLPPGHGATTDWEEWTYHSGMESHDHAMFGGIDASFLTKFAGIEATGPGYSTIRIAPVAPGDLEHAGASINTVRGEVASSWRRSGETFALEATVPANATAEVVVPVEAGEEVHESGGPVTSAPGVTFLREEGATAIYKVGSGDYHFTVGPPGFEPPSEEGGGGEETTAEIGGGATGGGSPGDSIAPGNSVGTQPPRSQPVAPPRPKLKATAKAAAGGKVSVSVVCVSSCPSGNPNVQVIASAPSGHPVFARVRKRLAGGRLSFSFKEPDGRTPGRLRLTVAGLASTKLVLTVRPTKR